MKSGKKRRPATVGPATGSQATGSKAVESEEKPETASQEGKLIYFSNHKRTRNLKKKIKKNSSELLDQ